MCSKMGLADCESVKPSHSSSIYFTSYFLNHLTWKENFAEFGPLNGYRDINVPAEATLFFPSFDEPFGHFYDYISFISYCVFNFYLLVYQIPLP